MTTTLPLPRHFTRPTGGIDATEMVELARIADVPLDGWQVGALEAGGARLPDKAFVARTVGILAGRQQGKTNLGIARALAGIFFADNQRVLYLSHLHVTARNTFERIVDAIERTPELRAQVRKIRRAHGGERIELLNGSVLAILSTGTRNGGRGFTADLVICDDAQTLSEGLAWSINVVVASSPNPQMWFLGTAVDELASGYTVGHPFTRLRRYATSLVPPPVDTMWLEYSVDDTRDDRGFLVADINDPAVIAQANPAGDRLVKSFGRDREILNNRTYLTERLSIGFWPQLHEDKYPARG